MAEVGVEVVCFVLFSFLFFVNLTFTLQEDFHGGHEEEALVCFIS